MIYFLNSTERVYNDKELNKLPQLLFGTGVFNSKSSTHALWKAGGDFLVEPVSSTMNVSAKPGAASVLVTSGGEQQRIVIQEDSQLVAAVPNNAGLAVRADAVVLRVLQSVINDDALNVGGSNAVVMVVVAGNSATPLTDQQISVALGGDPFVRLANLATPLNTTEINSGMITDARSMVKMTRATKLASDTLRLYALENDPSTPEQGDIWYNITDGILKMFDGSNVIGLQNQAFDWGYYPPDGVDSPVVAGDAIVENDSGVSLGSVSSGKFWQIPSTFLTSMFAQAFIMPNVVNPFVQLKMANPTWLGNARFGIYTADVNLNPVALVEQINVPSSQIPRNDYLDLYLDGDLYTPGNRYTIVVISLQTAIVDDAPNNQWAVAVQDSAYDADSFLLGYKARTQSGTTDNPLTLTWSSSSPITNRQLVMRISELSEAPIGQTDSAGKNFEIAQTFIAKSKDIIEFSVVKGQDIGSPTGDVDARLYAVDANNRPTGDILTSGTISEADIQALTKGEKITFVLEYPDLIVGNRYAVLLDAQNHSDANNYTVYINNNLASGYGSRYTTGEGWVSLGADILFETRTSPIRKIVVTNNAGKIPTELVDEQDIIDLLPPVSFCQDLALSVDVAITNDEFTFGSDNDGSVFFVLIQGGGLLYRFEKQTSGQYIETHAITPTLSVPSSDFGSIVKLGDYIYLFTNNGTNVVCSRFLATDLTGETVMTMADAIANTTNVYAWTDGVVIYLVSAQSSTTSRQLELTNPTTLTQIATATITNPTVNQRASQFYDVFNLAGADPKVFRIVGDTPNIQKMNPDATGIATAPRGIGVISDSQLPAIIINHSANTMYIGAVYAYYGASAKVATHIRLIPVNKF